MQTKREVNAAICSEKAKAEQCYDSIAIKC